jgi:uncharacterized repeat protein (TIGR03803 family)
MNRNKTLGMRGAVLLVSSLILALVFLPGALAQAKFKTLYDFSGSKDGEYPVADLIFDQAGNLYGTNGGADTAGTVFKLTPNSHGSWTESVLYSFCTLTNCADGDSSYAGLTFDAAGNLYGTTVNGGASGGGVVFKLASNADGSWTESVLYNFCSLTKCADGAFPAARLIFDRTGNLYGTAVLGGAHGFGIVFQLTPTVDNRWKEKVLHHFTGGKDGASPSASLIFDARGNLYSTTMFRGTSGSGNVFKLTPNVDGSWKESILYSFCSVSNCGDGAEPYAGLIFDKGGNLYGTTWVGGSRSSCPDGGGGCGVVFKLTPNLRGRWREKVIHRFTGDAQGGEPRAGVILDQAGNLYGTTELGGGPLSLCRFDGRAGCGVVFKLAPDSKGGWTETVLHRFVDHPGARPLAVPILDAAGILYGTTLGDGTTTHGSVFEITP